MLKKGWKWIKRGAWLFLAWFIIHETIIIYDGVSDDLGKANVAVIFGTTVYPDGTISDRLKARLDKGLELYNSGSVKEIFVSGGLGIEGHLEGTKMAEYLLAKGVSISDLTIDDQGNNTRLTALHFKEKFPVETSVFVVSQYYHIARAKLAMKQVGIQNVYGAHGDYSEKADAYSCTREFFGYYKYLLVY